MRNVLLAANVGLTGARVYETHERHKEHKENKVKQEQQERKNATKEVLVQKQAIIQAEIECLETRIKDLREKIQDLNQQKQSTRQELRYQIELLGQQEQTEIQLNPQDKQNITTRYAAQKMVLQQQQQRTVQDPEIDELKEEIEELKAQIQTKREEKKNLLVAHNNPAAVQGPPVQECTIEPEVSYQDHSPVQPYQVPMGAPVTVVYTSTPPQPVQVFPQPGPPAPQPYDPYAHPLPQMAQPQFGQGPPPPLPTQNYAPAPMFPSPPTPQAYDPYSHPLPQMAQPQFGQGPPPPLPGQGYAPSPAPQAPFSQGPPPLPTQGYPPGFPPAPSTSGRSLPTRTTPPEQANNPFAQPSYPQPTAYPSPGGNLNWDAQPNYPTSLPVFNQTPPGQNPNLPYYPPSNIGMPPVSNAPSSGPPPPLPNRPTGVAQTKERGLMMYSFTAGGKDEISLQAGEQIEIIAKTGSEFGYSPEWWHVQAMGRSGLVPSNYLKVV